MIPEAAIEAAARGMFAEEQCDRRQKLDVEANWRGRLDDRDRDEYRRLSRAALEAAAPHLANGVEWAVFRASDGPDGTPVENFRYRSREAAQAAISAGYTQAEYWEPRGREVGEWAT